MQATRRCRQPGATLFQKKRAFVAWTGVELLEVSYIGRILMSAVVGRGKRMLEMYNLHLRQMRKREGS